MGPNTFQALAASESSGGTCLAALDMGGIPWICQQAGPGGAWGPWQRPSQEPAPFGQIAMGSRLPDRLMIVLLDSQGWCWALARSDEGSRWDKWEGPRICNQKYSLAVLSAARHAGSGGILVFASDFDGKLWTIHRAKDGGWDVWKGPGFQNQKVAAGEVALAGQNNGCMILFTAHRGVVSYLAQQSANGPWGTWEMVPSVKPPPLLDGIVACQQGGSRGAVLWALNPLDGQVWTNYQEVPGGPFSSWNGPGFENQPVPFNRLACSGQGNGCAILFGLGYTGDLWAIGQTSPGGDWGAWQELKVL